MTERSQTILSTDGEAKKTLSWHEAMIQNTADAIIVHDLEGNITAWNQGAVRMYGYSEREALTMHIRQLTPPEKHNDLQHFITRLLQEEVTKSCETKRRTSRGDDLDIWLTVTPLKDDRNGIRAIASTERDITAHKRREKELEQTVALLQQSLTEVKTIQGIVPICSFCKDIRTDKGYYEKLENYFFQRSDLRFSHTVCPHCARIHYPDYVSKIKKLPRFTS